VLGPLSDLFESQVGSGRRGVAVAASRRRGEISPFRQPGDPRGTHGFASHPCGWFALIEDERGDPLWRLPRWTVTSPCSPRASLRTAVAKTLGRGDKPVKSGQEKSCAKSQEKRGERWAVDVIGGFV